MQQLWYKMTGDAQTFSTRRNEGKEQNNLYDNDVTSRGR